MMGNVGAIFLARKVASRTALELYIFVAAALALWKLVWVTRVFENFFAVERGGLASIGNYLVYAVSHTHLAVQLTLLVGVCALVAFIIDLTKSIAVPSLRIA